MKQVYLKSNFFQEISLEKKVEFMSELLNKKAKPDIFCFIANNLSALFVL